MSSMKVPAPRMKRSSSTRRTLWPMPLISSVSAAISKAP